MTLYHALGWQENNALDNQITGVNTAHQYPADSTRSIPQTVGRRLNFEGSILEEIIVGSAVNLSARQPADVDL